MSSATLFLVGSALVFLAERMFGGSAELRWPLLGLGVLLALAGIGMRARTLGRHPKATKQALAFYGLAAFALPVYFLGSREGGIALGLNGESLDRWRTALSALTPLVWLVGTLPAVAVDRMLDASPNAFHPRRLRTALDGGLTLAFGLAMLFPINWLAKEYNERWDFGFFKTTQVGESTRQLVENAPEPVRAVLFFPASSEVLREVKPYFDELSGENLTVEVMDQAEEPALAKEWRVRENGTIALVKGDDVETVKLTDKLDSARKDLRKLDSKVQTAMLKLLREKRTAYFTVGHNEFYWKSAANDGENIDVLKKGVEGLNFKVKELGLDDGLGTAVPDDAAVVFIVAPRKPFLPEEIEALRVFRDKGGAVFVMFEQGEEPVDPALGALFGVEYQAGPILTEKVVVKMTGGDSDKANIVSAKYGSHESISTMSKNASNYPFIAPGAGGIKELSEHPGKVTATIKGMSDWWLDVDGNWEFDKDTEKKGGIDLAVAASGPAEGGKEWRAAVVGDATWVSNLVLRQWQTSSLYVSETLAWLTQDPALGGEVENEEDVKIQHTKEGEKMWFYGTSFAVPVLILAGGMAHVRRRRKKEAA